MRHLDAYLVHRLKAYSLKLFLNKNWKINLGEEMASNLSLIITMDNGIHKLMA